MKKIALGVVAALLLAAFPVALAGTAGADTNAHIRFIASGAAGATPLDVYVDGLLLVKDLPVGGSFGNWFQTDAIGNGQHSIQVCTANGGLPLASGLCPANGANPGIFIAPGVGVLPQNTFSVIGGNNYTIVLGVLTQTNVGVPGLFVGLNDDSPTDYGFARLTIHNAVTALGPTIDVCVDGDKVLTAIAGGTTQQVEVEAQQNANLQIFPSSIGCPGAGTVTNLVAGTNLIITLVQNSYPSCTTDCGQVLFVDQERHPNVANTSAFCANVINLAKFQADYKTVLGGVDPNDSLTYPSRGAVSDLVAEIDSTVTAGDLTVPGEIQPQWETISAGLRMLSQVLKLVDYNVAGFPVVSQTGDHVSLEQIVEGANGFSLPGTSDPDLVAAVSALTNWYKANCAPAPTPAAPAAVPAAAGPRFTG